MRLQMIRPMFTTLKRILPLGATRRLRAAATAGKSYVDELRFRGAVQELRATPGPDVPGSLMERLNRAWGNETWSGNPLYLGTVAKVVADSPGPILECGTGLSTVIAGVMGARNGIEIWGLEQDTTWHERIQRVVRQFHLHNVHTVLAPLREYGDFLWYDISRAALPSHFALVLCDGPAIPEGPGKARSRYGLLPVLTQHGISVDDILVDDVNNERVVAMVRAWEDEFGRTSQIVSEQGGNYGLLRRKHVTTNTEPHFRR